MATCGLPRVAAVLPAAASAQRALSRPLPPPSADTVAPGVPGGLSPSPARAEAEPPTKPPIGVLRAEAPSGWPPAVADTTLAALGSAAVLRAASQTGCAACESLSALGATSQR